MSDLDPLQCAICEKRHKDPRILDCFHSFCRECIERYVNRKHFKNTFSCPTCRLDIQIPKSGVKGLKQNFYIRAIQASAAFSTISTCDTCTDSEQAAARCLECESNYCEPCVSRHADSEESRDHHVVHLSQPECRSVTKLTYKSYCEKHKEETCYYCLLCEVPICKECVSKLANHKGHRYKSIAEGARDKRGNVKPIIQSMHEYLPCLQDYLNELKSCREILGNYAQETINEIKSRCKYLQDEIQKICNSLVRDVEDKLSTEFERIENHVKEIKTTLFSVSSITKSAEEVINLGNDSDVVLMCEKLQNRFKHADKEIPKMGLNSAVSSNFNAGESHGSNLEELFGYCDTTDIKMPMLPIPWGLRIALNFDVELLFSFKAAAMTDTVHAIAPISEKEAWVCCGWGTNQMHLFSREGDKLKSVTMEIQIDDIVARSNGDLFVSSYDGKKIVKVDEDLKQTDFVKLNWYPGGMTLTKKQELLVCAVDSYVTTRSSISQRMVIRINADSGEIIDQIEDDGFSPLFTAPYRLYENMLGDVVLSDREENNVHTITITMDGFVKNKYSGQNDFIVKKPFNPFGIVSDKQGHVLVSDWSNHSIHLLDLSGQFCGFLITDNYGIRGPNALALDKAGNLWVGDTKSTVWGFRYARRGDNS